jgi:O-antigen ligase
MSTGLIFYSSNLPRKLISRIANVIIALPIISVFASIALFPISGKAPWSIEYTGAYRLTGYLPPAHLAMLCVAAIMICSFKMSEGTQKMGYLTLGTLLLILLATGTRGALIAGITAAIPQIKIPRTLNSLLITFILTIPIGLVGGKALDNILFRNTQQTDYEQINLSGRSTAWAFFLEKSGDAFYFGKGLGAVTKVTKDETQHNLHFFVTPHNEYLRFLYDIGLVGLLLLITGSVIFYLKIKNKLPENEKNAFLAIALSFAIYSGIDNTFGTPQFLIPFFLILKYARTKRLSYCEQQA